MVNTDVLELANINGQNIHRLKGNVIFKQQQMMIYCDSAYKPVKKNESLQAFGHVRMTQGDTSSLTSNTMVYNPESKIAVFRGKVVFKDKNATLYTDVLEYNTANKTATYKTGGRLIDKKSILTSDFGAYNSQSKMFYFRQKVKAVGPQGTLLTDTLDYNSNTKIAIFKGPSELIKIDGVVHADYGEYKTDEAVSRVKGRAKVESGDYIITGDDMYNDEVNKRSVIKNNVSIISIKDKITIEGDMVYHWGKLGYSKVFGNPVMKSYAESDTLYVIADTLISIDNAITKQKKLFAYKHSKIYRSDIQGKCDSLVYNFADSIIHFYKDPVLWSEANQILADSIYIQMANKKIDKLHMNINSFIISTDSLKNFNQVKGKRMIAHFKESNIQKVDVFGNGESLYFALEGDTALVGMNKIVCTDMIINFDSSKVSTISFITSPEGTFIPPHEIEEPARRLKGFRWRVAERPIFADTRRKKLK
jgi:lipopolysaccharide export system protein LptA